MNGLLFSVTSIASFIFDSQKYRDGFSFDFESSQMPKLILCGAPSHMTRKFKREYKEWFIVRVVNERKGKTLHSYADRNEFLI